MSDNTLHDLMQSAYKQFHSKEMTLVCVQNNILRALDNNSGVYLALIHHCKVMIIYLWVMKRLLHQPLLEIWR